MSTGPAPDRSIRAFAAWTRAYYSQNRWARLQLLSACLLSVGGIRRGLGPVLLATVVVGMLLAYALWAAKQGRS